MVSPNKQDMTNEVPINGTHYKKKWRRNKNKKKAMEQNNSNVDKCQTNGDKIDIIELPKLVEDLSINEINEVDDCAAEICIPHTAEEQIDIRQTDPAILEIESCCSSLSPMSQVTSHSPNMVGNPEHIETDLDSNGSANEPLQHYLPAPTLSQYTSAQHLQSQVPSLYHDFDAPTLPQFSLGWPMNLSNQESLQPENIQEPLQENFQNLFKIPVDHQPNEEDYLHIHNEDFVSCTINVPNEFIGKLLGKGGRFINKIKADASINIEINRHVIDGCKACYIIGPETNVCKAIDTIKRLFPSKIFIEMARILRDVTLCTAPPLNRVSVSLGNDSDIGSMRMIPVKVMSVDTVNVIYIHTLDHPLYPQLQAIEHSLQVIYGKYATKNIPFPCSVGSFCVGFVNNEWHRAEVIQCNVDSERAVVFLPDRGLTVEVHHTYLKEALRCFTEIPFFAEKVYLNNIQVGYDPELITAGNNWLADQANTSPMSAHFVGRSQDQTAVISLYVHRYYENINYGLVGNINKELVDLMFAHNSVNNHTFHWRTTHVI